MIHIILTFDNGKTYTFYTHDQFTADIFTQNIWNKQLVEIYPYTHALPTQGKFLDHLENVKTKHRLIKNVKKINIIVET